MTKVHVLAASVAALISFGLVAQACACPMIGRFVNFNCDQDGEDGQGEAKIVFVGDSITRGIGDKSLNNRTGGFVRDLEEMFPEARMVNFGVPGITTRRMLRDMKKNTKSGAKIISSKFARGDVFQIQLGTNDYWDENSSPGRAVRYLKRIRKYIIRYLQQNYGEEPIVYFSTLPRTRRDFQNPFIDEVNDRLLRFAKKLVKVRPDKLPKKIVSKDMLHPNARGYERMASLVADYLTGDLISEELNKLPDADADGIYDRFESTRFGTLPDNPDSDGDSIPDGDEVFIHYTNPLSVDTDGDGISDADELNQGSDPNSALSTPEP